MNGGRFLKSTELRVEELNFDDAKNQTQPYIHYTCSKSSTGFKAMMFCWISFLAAYNTWCYFDTVPPYSLSPLWLAVPKLPRIGKPNEKIYHEYMIIIFKIICDIHAIFKIIYVTATNLQNLPNPGRTISGSLPLPSGKSRMSLPRTSMVWQLLLLRITWCRSTRTRRVTRAMRANRDRLFSGHFSMLAVEDWKNLQWKFEECALITVVWSCEWKTQSQINHTTNHHNISESYLISIVSFNFEAVSRSCDWATNDSSNLSCWMSANI